MKVIGIVVVGVVLLLLLMMDKKQIQKMMSVLSVFWFRLAFAFLILFTMNVAGGFIGIYVPVNIASGLVTRGFRHSGIRCTMRFCIVFIKSLLIEGVDISFEDCCNLYVSRQ